LARTETILTTPNDLPGNGAPREGTEGVIRFRHELRPPVPGDVPPLECFRSGFHALIQTLDLTEHTVKAHLKAIFNELGVHNRTECVAQARVLGLI
jgi:hypothetical protein